MSIDRQLPDRRGSEIHCGDQGEYMLGSGFIKLNSIRPNVCANHI